MLERARQLVLERGDDLRQFAAYVIVSGGALVVDITIYWVLLEVFSFAFMAAAGGYAFGVATHYLLSSRVVFRNQFHKRGVVEEAPTIARFFAASASGLLVTAAVVGMLADGLGVNPLVAKIGAAGCSFIAVFFSLRLFVFKGLVATAYRSA